MFSSQTLPQNSPEIRVKTEENKAKALRLSVRASRGRSRRLHRRGGVAHYGVVVGRRAVTLQTGVQGRVIETEVQRGD